jgi:hypothetical protein
MTYLIIVANGLLFLWAYRLGLKDGRAIKEDKPLTEIKLPELPKLKSKKEKEQEEKAKKEIDRLGTIMSNIDNYNGTSIGQKEVE